MKIGIDCRMLGPEQGGLGRYVEQLVFHLSQTDFINQYVLFVRPQNAAAVKIGNPKFQYTTVMADLPWYGWREQIFLKKIITREKVDLMHFPHWNVPLSYNEPFVVTIHDLLLLEYPTRAASTLGPISYWFKNKMYKKVLRHAANQAAHILTTSEFTKQDIVKKLGIEPNKLTVTYQAPFLVKPGGQKISLEKWGITKPYVLYVGVAYPHKNLEKLVEAWALVSQKTDQAYQLILVGKNNYFYEQLKIKVKENQYLNIIFTDFIPDVFLPELYTRARLFVYPSLYEGFGLPPLEAWVCGLPVAASNQSCLPEVLGTGAFYFDPNSAANMAEIMVQALENDQARAEVIKQAIQEIKRFSWENLTTQTLRVYKQSRAQAE